MVVRRVLGAAAAWLGVACAGEIHAGVPLVDAGDEFTTLEPATAAAVDRDAAVESGIDASSPSNPAPPANKPPAAIADARAPTAPKPMPTADAAPSGGARDASANPTGDAALPSNPGTPTARDLSSGRSQFLGAPRCDRAGALLCDDFESEAVGAGPDVMVWSAPFGNLPKVDATRAARGQKSLYFELAAGLPGHIEEKKTFPLPNNTMYGRMFVWIDELPTAPAFAQWTLVSALGSDQPAEVRLGGQLDPGRENANWFGLGSDHGESGDWATAGREPQSKVRAKDWICLEWMFKGDVSETDVWIDGIKQSSLHLTAAEYRQGDQEAGKRFVQPRFDRLRIGWWLYQTGALPSPAKVWIDEVVVDDERVGCVL